MGVHDGARPYSETMVEIIMALNRSPHLTDERKSQATIALIDEGRRLDANRRAEHLAEKHASDAQDQPK